jgi:hypothetical protein
VNKAKEAGELTSFGNDTAGRLHTKSLMDEIKKKVRKTIAKAMEGAGLTRRSSFRCNHRPETRSPGGGDACSKRPRPDGIVPVKPSGWNRKRAVMLGICDELKVLVRRIISANEQKIS